MVLKIMKLILQREFTVAVLYLLFSSAIVNKWYFLCKPKSNINMSTFFANSLSNTYIIVVNLKILIS